MTLKKKNAEGVIKDIKQQTLKLFSAEEKIRIVIEGIKQETIMDRKILRNNLRRKIFSDVF